MKRLLGSLKSNKLYLLMAVIIITIIIIHGKFENFFKVDDLTLLLLVLLLALPIIPSMKTWKLKYGNFEAEISKEEINDVLNKAKDVTSKDIQDKNVDNTLDLKEQAELDPKFALAKVGVEINERIETLFNIYLKDNNYKGRKPSSKSIIDRLEKKAIIDTSLATILKSLIDITNRTIHGEDISPENASSFVEIAYNVLWDLEFAVVNHALKTAKKEVIDQKVVEEYNNAEYLLTTITPILNGPYKSVYRVNQAELDAFLEGYDEYAEYIIDFRKI